MSLENEFRDYALRILWQNACLPSQVCILLALKMNPYGLTTNDFRGLNGAKHRRVFQRNVQKLVAVGLVKVATGDHNQKRYTLTERGNGWQPLPSDRGKA